MKEFSIDSIELWSFNLCQNKFHLLVLNSHVQFWRDFFEELESGENFDSCKKNLLLKVFLLKKTKDRISSIFYDYEKDIEIIWEKFPDYFEGNLESNFNKLLRDPIFQSILREFKLKKIID